jgi:hypothetical protein
MRPKIWTLADFPAKLRNPVWAGLAEKFGPFEKPGTSCKADKLPRFGLDVRPLDCKSGRRPQADPTDGKGSSLCENAMIA